MDLEGQRKGYPQQSQQLFTGFRSQIWLLYLLVLLAVLNLVYQRIGCVQLYLYYTFVSPPSRISVYSPSVEKVETDLDEAIRKLTPETKIARNARSKLTAYSMSTAMYTTTIKVHKAKS